jgi:1,5-anhydro-D-fructose reductase (1,5-anhydro-D-mannitol-forming)
VPFLTPLKVAVLGFWHVHAADYSQEVQQHPGTELVAVWDDDQVRGLAAADAFGVAYADDLESLLAQDELDAVVVTTSTSAHRDVMVKTAQAGKHIFTEKVLAPTVAEAEEIIEVADANGVKVVVSLPRLYTGYTHAISEIIGSGQLGRLTYGRVRLSHDGAVSSGADPGWLPERFFDPATAIGGALTDLGCHPVYLIQRFLGSRPETVSATYRSVTNRRVEDHAVVTVGYPDQKIGVIEAGFVSDNPFTVEIFGTRGRIRYSDDGSGLVVAGQARGGDESHSVPVPDDGRNAFAQWIEHITHDTRADDNLAAALELTRLVVAANRAAAEGRTISYVAA